MPLCRGRPFHCLPTAVMVLQKKAITMVARSWLSGWCTVLHLTFRPVSRHAVLTGFENPVGADEFAQPHSFEGAETTRWDND